MGKTTKNDYVPEERELKVELLICYLSHTPMECESSTITYHGFHPWLQIFNPAGVMEMYD